MNLTIRILTIVNLLFLIGCGQDLSNLPSSKDYISTRFEFRYGRETRIVDDPENQLRWVYGEMPNSITVENGIRIIVYDQHHAIIKSEKDSIEVYEDKVKYLGYMGAQAEDTYYVIRKHMVVPTSRESNY